MSSSTKSSSDQERDEYYPRLVEVPFFLKNLPLKNKKQAQT